jgi:hypothetical protein
MQPKAVALMLVLGGALLSGPAAVAETSDEDVQWVMECISDNKRAGAGEDVVRKYCVCMNNKMAPDESRSISEWEKTHESERAACDAEAGWK